jgi:hypothetical protein
VIRYVIIFAASNFHPRLCYVSFLRGIPEGKCSQKVYLIYLEHIMKNSPENVL